MASNGDGLIVAANRQARDLGIAKFSFVTKYQHLFDSGKCTLFSSNYKLYQSMSDRLLSCLAGQDIFSDMQSYSIDEAFGELPACVTDYYELVELGRTLRRAAWRQTRLPIGIGGGNTFTLAKCASYIGKKVPGYRGICMVIDENVDDLLRLIPVGEVWNVGRATSAILFRQGIHTALDLRRLSTQDARSWGGVNLERTVRELRGERVYSMDSFPDCNTRKEVSSSLSLSVRAETEIDLHQALSQRIAVASEKLRRLGFTTRHMVLFAQNSRFDDHPRSFQSQVVFEYPTDDTRLLLAALTRKFGELYCENISYYKVGCRLLGLEQVEFQQTDLFAPPVAPKLMQTVDALNRRFGYHAVTVGSQKVDGQAKMLRKHLSPDYLGSWRDIPVITC